MCLAIPMKIVKATGNKAGVSLGGLKKEIDIRFLEDLQPGNYVIVHAGFAIDKLDAEEAEKTLDMIYDFKKHSNR